MVNLEDKNIKYLLQSVNLYDKVTLIGGDLLPAKKVANECGINTYVLFTNIRNRVPRVYKEKDNYTEINY